MRRACIAAVAISTTACLLPAAADAGAATRFGAPVRLTPDTAGGYEPAVTRGPHGSILVTAHKENSTLAVAPSPADAVPARLASWAWLSRDGGRTYESLPVPPQGSVDPAGIGIESDVVADDAGHVYLADISVQDLVVHRWTVTDTPAYDGATPLRTARDDDRPWLAAHGDGRVVYLSNGAATGDDGDYTVFASADGARTFSEPVVLPDSGWCRPAADHAPGSRRFYAVCGARSGPGGTAYTSDDDGLTWRDVRLPERPDDVWELFPTIATDSRGLVVVATATQLDITGGPNVVLLYVSRNHGRTWSRRALPLPVGQWSYATVDVTSRGRLGLAAYHRAGPDDDWQVLAGTFGLAELPRLAPLDRVPAAGAGSPYPSGDLMGAAFDDRGRLTVSWTRTVVMVEHPTVPAAYHLHREIWAATQLPD